MQQKLCALKSRVEGHNCDKFCITVHKIQKGYGIKILTKLIVLQMLQARMSEAGDDWIMAANPRTRCQGEVPTNYITYAHGYSAALDAFKETDRPGATNLLHSRDYLNKFNYVVRPSSGWCFEMTA